jgi:hypothetical protein
MCAAGSPKPMQRPAAHALPLKLGGLGCVCGMYTRIFLGHLVPYRLNCFLLFW